MIKINGEMYFDSQFEDISVFLYDHDTSRNVFIIEGHNFDGCGVIHADDDVTFFVKIV